MWIQQKILLANTMAVVADAAFATDEVSVAMTWLGAICYTLQIYFDFSGYSEMAIGLGLMFGFEFLENFNYPYISKTVTEFWRRWHISLGTWFRDYVYFPLGGSRVNSKFRLIFNIFIVWTITGIWHGANWTFMIWGVFYGVIICVEKVLNLPKKLPNYPIAEGFYQVLTMLAVILGWVMFRSEDWRSALTYMGTMFGQNGTVLLDDNTIYYFREYIVFLVAGCIGSIPIFPWIREKWTARGEVAAHTYLIVSFAAQFLLFWVGISCLVMNAHNPFIYFNF